MDLHKKLILIFGLNRPNVQMYCVSFNNVTILTGLVVLMASAQRLPQAAIIQPSIGKIPNQGLK